MSGSDAEGLTPSAELARERPGCRCATWPDCSRQETKRWWRRCTASSSRSAIYKRAETVGRRHRKMRHERPSPWGTSWTAEEAEAIFRLDLHCLPSKSASWYRRLGRETAIEQTEDPYDRTSVRPASAQSISTQAEMVTVMRQQTHCQASSGRLFAELLDYPQESPVEMLA